MDDNILEDLFHGVAFEAFIAEVAETGALPDIASTRIRAYAAYEQELAKRHAKR